MNGCSLFPMATHCLLLMDQAPVSRGVINQPALPAAGSSRTAGRRSINMAVRLWENVCYKQVELTCIWFVPGKASMHELVYTS